MRSKEFEQGQIVKSKNRTEVAQLFVMVLLDRIPSKTQFKGVVIKDMTDWDGGYEAQAGFVTNDWNTDQFELTTWEEVKLFL